MKPNRHKRGFTLTEIMIALVVLAVLAGLAVPNYARTVEQSRIQEAVTTINIIHMGQKIYRLNNNTFWNGGSNASVANIDTNLNVDISPTFYTDIDFSGVSAAGYTVQVNRNSTSGGNTAWNYNYAWVDATKALTVTRTPS